MRFIHHVLNNPHFIAIVVVLLIVWGAVSFVTIPRSEDPQLEFSGASVFVVYPGANPENIEKMVVEPIEEELNKLADVSELSSSSAEDVALVNIEFLATTDPDEKYREVVTAMEKIRDKLPDDIVRFETSKYNSGDVAILQYALMIDPFTYSVVHEHAKALKKRLQRIAGVQKVELHACPEERITIELTPEKMEAAGLTFDKMAQVLQGSNRIIPAGAVVAGKRRFSLQVNSEYTSLEDIGSTIVGAYGSQSVRLADIATIRRTDGDTLYRARFNGKRAMFLTVAQKKGTNIFTVSRMVKEAVADFMASGKLPGSVELVFDQSRSVDNRLNGFFVNLLQGMGLVTAVMLLVLGIRAAVIIALVIPLSIVTAIGVLDVTGYGLDQISIVALAIALGMLVDNAIVVVELVSRKKAGGMGPNEAASRSITEIGWAIVNSTVTTVIAFLPMALLNSYTGDFIRGLPLTVIYALTASLLFALTLTPLMAGKWIGGKAASPMSGSRAFLYRVAETNYRHLLSWTVKRPRRVIIAAVLFFLGSLLLVRFVPVSLFPSAEKPQIIVSVEAPKGTSIVFVDSTVRTIEKILGGHPGVLSYASNVGKGNPRIYYNMFSLWESQNTGQIVASMQSGKEAFIAGMLDTLRKECAHLTGVKIHLRELRQGMPVAAPIAIRVTGEDLDSIRIGAGRVEKIISAASGTVNVRNPADDNRTDLRIVVDKKKAALAGIASAQVARELRTAVLGIEVTQFNDPGGNDVPVMLHFGSANPPSMEEIALVRIPAITGDMVPLRHIADVEFGKSPSVINHYRLERTVTVLADVKSGTNTALLTAAIRDSLEHTLFPKGVSWNVAGEEESRNESFGGITKALLVALIGIFAVLVLQFKNFRQPFIVFTAIPFAVSGSIIALAITGYSFSFTAFVGLTSLMGIVVNNSIVLIDCANLLMRDCSSTAERIVNASVQRFTPILLTTVTTMLGLLPLLMSGSSLWAPMSWVIFGGLAVSTILTLFIVPALYVLYTKRVP